MVTEDRPPVCMGNLLRVLYSRENDSPNRVDIFVDFESEFTDLIAGVGEPGQKCQAF